MTFDDAVKDCKIMRIKTRVIRCLEEGVLLRLNDEKKKKNRSDCADRSRKSSVERQEKHNSSSTERRGRKREAAPERVD
ncbi:hypothetical protein TNCV_1752761 [Trichonephila clavipes]|nr:hypothetical protein TNCV_1752761 [Trichonephila clavipes]